MSLIGFVLGVVNDGELTEEEELCLDSVRMVLEEKGKEISSDFETVVQKWGKCVECGELYYPRVRKDQRFCSGRCRNRFKQRVWRERHSGEDMESH